MEFGDEGQSLARIARSVDAARECGFAAVSANDHFLFGTPWLDGPTALAAMVERSGAMQLATTVSLVSLRGPVQLAKTLAALDLLSNGRVVAGVGPGSSERDYHAVGVPFEERWPRFDEAVAALRSPRARVRAGAGPTPSRRRPDLDRQLGLEGRHQACRSARRRMACVRLQHEPGRLRRGTAGARGRAPRERPRAGWLPERARDDVDLDHRGRPRRGARAARRTRAAPEPGARDAP